MIELFVESVNNSLDKYNLSLNKEQVISEYKEVEKDWDKIALGIPKPIKYLIVGEATVSYHNYFYNPKSVTSSFLNPNHFNCKTKSDLINLFHKSSVLVFDLYPLPLPTFIYDNVAFKCTDPVYKTLLNKYYEKKLDKLIDENTIVVLRYMKLFYRCEWKLFTNLLHKKGVKIILVNKPKTVNKIKTTIKVPLNISNSISADKKKISKIFGSIIPS